MSHSDTIELLFGIAIIVFVAIAIYFDRRHDRADAALREQARLKRELELREFDEDA